MVFMKKYFFGVKRIYFPTVSSHQSLFFKDSVFFGQIQYAYDFPKFSHILCL